MKAEEHPERIKLREEQQEARDKAREAAKVWGGARSNPNPDPNPNPNPNPNQDQGMVAQIRAAAMFNPKCVFGCFARLDSGLDRFFNWISSTEALMERTFSNR